MTIYSFTVTRTPFFIILSFHVFEDEEGVFIVLESFASARGMHPKLGDSPFFGLKYCGKDHFNGRYKNSSQTGEDKNGFIVLGRTLPERERSINAFISWGRFCLIVCTQTKLQP